jgi:hypothetical protein
MTEHDPTEMPTPTPKCNDYVCIPHQVIPLAFFILLGLVVFSFVFEKISHKIESLAAKWDVSSKIVEHVYRELSIVGLISFLFFLTQRYGDLESFISSTALDEVRRVETLLLAHLVNVRLHMQFENAHVLIFLSMIYYIMIVGFILLSTYLTSRFVTKSFDFRRNSLLFVSRFAMFEEIEIAQEELERPIGLMSLIGMFLNPRIFNAKM